MAGNEIYNYQGATPSVSYSNIEGGIGATACISACTDGGNNIDTNPLFANLANNDYRITGVSPCADVGNDAANTENDDIRGAAYARKLNKTDGTTGTIDMGAYEYKFGTDPQYPTLNWTSGSSTSDWNTSGNWDAELVPISTYHVTIPDLATDPIISNTATICNNLTISSGASLDINETKDLTVNGDLANNGTLAIKSSATGTGSLIINGAASGNATIQRYFTGSSWDWHLISSPVVNQAIQNEFVPAEFTSSEDFYTWYEPANIWVNFKYTSGDPPTWATANGDATFTEAKGYLVAYEAANPTKTFTGVPNVGQHSIALTKTGSETHSSTNLVGNPYTSSIDWKAASGWDRSHLVNNSGYDMHIWNQSANNFGVYNSAADGDNGTNSVTRYIPPMQGFFVIANTAGNLVMNKEIQVHNGASN